MPGGAGWFPLHPLQNRGQILQAVLQWRAGEGPTPRTAQPLGYSADVRIGVLDPLCLIKDDQIPLARHGRVGVAREVGAQRFITGEIEMSGGPPTPGAVAGLTIYPV